MVGGAGVRRTVGGTAGRGACRTPGGGQVSTAPRPRSHHVRVVLVVEEIGRQQHHGRLAGVLPPVRGAFHLGGGFAGPMHDRHRTGAAILGDRPTDDVDDRRPVGVAVPRDDSPRLNDEPAQAQRVLLQHDGLVDEIDFRLHRVGDALRLGGAHLLSLAVGHGLARRTCAGVGRDGGEQHGHGERTGRRKSVPARPARGCSVQHWWSLLSSRWRAAPSPPWADNAGSDGSSEIPIGLGFDTAHAWGPGPAVDSCLRAKGFQPWSRALILVGGLARASAAVMHGCRDASTMEMHQVRYFLTVARTLNFTRAAEQCNVSQPALTRAIRQLEEELGGELLRREGKLSHLTELGQRMLPLMQQCYDSALAAKSHASSLKKGVASPLALGLSHTIDMRLLTPVLTELQRAVAGLQLKVLRGNAGEIAEALQKGRVEFAIAGPLGQTWDRLE